MKVGRVPYDPTQDVTNAQSRAYNQQSWFVLRWTSSRTIKAAVLREAALRGAGSPGKVGKELAPKADELEVELVADVMVRFPQTTEPHLMENTFLRPASNYKKQYPSRVEFHRNAEGRVTSVSFFFPRNDRDAKPWLSPRETVVDFECWVGGANLKAKFEPPKMVAHDGVDL